jgi:hypothetical protein
MIKEIDTCDYNILQDVNFIVKDAEYLANIIKKPCRITFYISEHRNWNQMQSLPVFEDNERFTCLGPKPMIEIYHCKYKNNLELDFLKDIKKKYNITDFVVACMSPNFIMNWHTDWFGGKRLHIPIVTNDQCFLETEELKVNCQTNKVYILDTEVEHTACNLGNSNRLHLIGDLNAM